MAKHILPTILTRSFDRYHEPFCGGAAIFFELGTKKPAFLNDKIPQIIKIFQALKDDPVFVFAEFKQLSEDLWERGGPAYYDVRERASTAAEWMFLFYSSFNGLIRFSNKDANKFNASWGKRYSKRGDAQSMIKPVHTLVTLERMTEMSAALQNVELSVGDYWPRIEKCGAGDFLYVDPPYSFNGKDEASEVYGHGWTPDDDRLLADRLKFLEKNGASWVLSNVAKSRGKRNSLYMDELYPDHKKKEIPYRYTIAKYSTTEADELLILSKY